MSRRPSWLTSNFVTKFTTTHINSSNFEWFGGFVTINEMLVLSKCYRWFWNTRGLSSSDWVSYYRGERRGQVWTKRPETSFLTLRCFQACLSSFPVLNPTKRLISAPLHSVSRHRRSDIVKFGLIFTSPHLISIAASDQGQRDGISGRRGLLPRVQRHRQRDKREGHSSQHKVGFSGNITEFFMRWPFSRLLAQTSLRNILGTKNLHEILSDRDSIAGAMQVSPTQQLIFISQNKWFLTELAGRGHCRLGNKSGKSRNVRFTLLPFI